ncbi:MAG: hypothetical protein AAGJ35_09810, partial [Myxococcota bacterium]
MGISTDGMGLESSRGSSDSLKKSLPAWSFEDVSKSKPWQRLHCHQPLLCVEVQIDRIYALLKGGLRMVAYRFPGGQPIAECLLPFQGNKLLVTQQGVAVLHQKEGRVTMWERSHLSEIVRIPVGQMPSDMVLLSKKFLLVTNREDGSLSLLDLQAGKEVERILVGGAPNEIVQHPRHLIILHRGFPQMTLLPLSVFSR